MTRPAGEDPSGVVARIRSQVTAVAREADAAPGRSRRLATWVLLVSLLFSVVGAVVAITAASRTSGLESADRIQARTDERLARNRAALAVLNGCLLAARGPQVPTPAVGDLDPDAWLAARAAALGLLVERGGACAPAGIVPTPSPSSRTTSSSPTSAPRTRSSPPARATPPGAASPTAGAAPRVVVPGAPGAAGAAGAPGPAGPAAPAPAPRPALIPLLPQPLLPPLL